MSSRMSTIPLTSLALVAFAANALLARAALSRELIDPVSFTSIRLISGAALLQLLTLAPAVSARRKQKRTLLSSAALFGYAFCFSLGYSRVTAGTGTLLMIGAVQLLMFAIALRHGERPAKPQWIGGGIAAAGLTYLMLPGVQTPSASGAALILLSGACWGVYTALGKKSADPLRATARNFAGTAIPAAIVSALCWNGLEARPAGIGLALVSGTLTSALAYAVWYRALRGLSTISASLVQLAIPALAIAGGHVLLEEPLGWRLIGSSGLILGGIALALVPRKTESSGAS